MEPPVNAGGHPSGWTDAPEPVPATTTDSALSVAADLAVLNGAVLLAQRELTDARISFWTAEANLNEARAQHAKIPDLLAAKARYRRTQDRVRVAERMLRAATAARNDAQR